MFGAAAGAFLGLLELWFYKFDISHLLAAMSAGALYMVIITFFIEHLQFRSSKQLFIGASAGCISGMIWWLIAKPDSSLILAIFIGIVFGALFPWVESKKKPYNNSLKRDRQ